ncbi:MAG: hypothetical protein H6657_28395 [Ardenticatenaceae bacterium]|nr:hypothetical protein [Ardenticatenaceae bacterium]
MKRIFLLFVGFSVSFFLILVSGFGQATAGTSNPLTVELLSSHSQTSADTSFNNYGYGLVAGVNSAHVYWQESGNGAEGADLFYRQLPGGNTVRLSDPALSEGDVDIVWFDTAVGQDNTFHIAWLETGSATEAYDLFYWSAATGTLLLTDRTQTEGYVEPAFGTLTLLLDANDKAHIIWFEETNTAEGSDLFYWSLTTETVLLTDHSQTEGSGVGSGPNKLVLDDNGTAHVTWGEYGTDGVTAKYFYWNPSLSSPVNLPSIRSFIVADNVAHIIWQSATEGPIVYWNSTTQTAQPIPSSADTPGGIINTGGLMEDSTGVVHIFWVKGIAGVCLAHWDTAGQTTEDLVTGTQCYPFWNVFLDSSDNFHTIVVDQPTSALRFRYWNEKLTTPVTIPIGSSISQGKLMGIEGTNEVHVTWIETVGSDDNYYHWDNISQNATNLSTLAGADTHISSSGIQVLPSSNSELYMLWSEGINGTGTFHNLYWNSLTNTTTDLFTDLGISSINSGFDPMIVNFLPNGEPYTVWPGTPTSGPEGLYLWDSSQDTVHLAGESVPCSALGKYFSSGADSAGNIYVAWQDEGTKTNYLWSQASGQINLSQTTATETACDPPLVVMSDNSRLFAMWIEESDVADEGLDVYGGWSELPGFDIYLPMITR